MPLKRLVFLTCIVVLFLSGYPYNVIAYSGSSQGGEISPPDHVFYELYFRYIDHLMSKAALLEKKGIDSNPLRTTIAQESKLTSTQTDRMIDIASKVMIDITELDKMAKQIVDNEYSRHPNGKLGLNEPVPEPPKILTDLQLRRNAIFAQAQEKLMNVLGYETFTVLDNFVKTRVKPKLVHP